MSKRGSWCPLVSDMLKRPHPPAPSPSRWRGGGMPPLPLSVAMGRGLGGGALLAVLLALYLWLPHAVHAQDADRPVVDGIALERTSVGSVALFIDPDVDAETIATASMAIRVSLRDVP